MVKCSVNLENEIFIKSFKFNDDKNTTFSLKNINNNTLTHTLTNISKQIKFNLFWDKY